VAQARAVCGSRLPSGLVSETEQSARDGTQSRASQSSTNNTSECAGVRAGSPGRGRLNGILGLSLANRRLVFSCLGH